MSSFRGALDLLEIATPTRTPAAGRRLLYFKSDGALWAKPVGGVEYKVSADALPAGGTTAHYLRGDAAWATLNKAAVGLGNVDNVADASKPVSTAQAAAIALKANLASPAFTGAPTTPTPTTGTGLANKFYVDGAVAAISPMGQSLGIAKATSSYSSSNNTFSPTLGVVTGMSISFTGTGRPVILEFTCAQAYNTGANVAIGVGITLKTGAGAVTQVQSFTFMSASTAYGPAAYVRYLFTTVPGTSYVAAVNSFAISGTYGLVATAGSPMEFTVTQR